MLLYNINDILTILNTFFFIACNEPSTIKWEDVNTKIYACN